MTDGKDLVHQKEYGLKKREYFAAMAMQGLLASGLYAAGIAYNPVLEKLSCDIADNLIAELNKTT